MVSKGKVVRVPVIELFEDESLYPRRHIDEQNVSRLAAALEAGNDLPPVVADKESKKIIDGWHRTRAHIQIFGIESVIEVELRSYASRGAMIEDAIALNSTHGIGLTPADQARAATMANNEGVSVERIASALHIPPRKVEHLLIRIVEVPRGSPGTIPGTTQIPLKRPVHHLADAKLLTREQAEAIKSAPGTPYLLVIRQIYDAVYHNLINWNDPHAIEALHKLRDELNRCPHLEGVLQKEA